MLHPGSGECPINGDESIGTPFANLRICSRRVGAESRAAEGSLVDFECD